MVKKISPNKLKGTVHIPASKSDSQRAILCAALVNGKSVLYNVGVSEDDKNMLRVVQELGADVYCIDEVNRVFEIDGTNAFKAAKSINIGESGLGIRLITAVLSAFNHPYIINGKGSLLTRPMDFYAENLPKLGVSFDSNKGLVPLTVNGPISNNEITVDGSLSSQFISGLLMALPLSETGTVLHVQDLKSVPYVQMTLDTLSQFGIEIESNIAQPTKMKSVPSIDDIYKHIMGITAVDVLGDTDATMTTFRIKGAQTYQPIEYKIESDWSSASYWITAKLLGAELTITGLNTKSLQADKKVLDLIDVDIESFLGENSHQLNQPFNFDATHCPDLFPALVTLAAYQKGISTIKGVHRLKHKESDRGEVLKAEFAKLGVEIDLKEDNMLIYGTGKVTGGRVSSNHDHRIAMCIGIAAVFAESNITIDTAEAVGKSYPEFWNDLFKLQEV